MLVKIHFLDDVADVNVKDAEEAMRLVATIGVRKLKVIELFAPTLALTPNGYIKDETNLDINVVTSTSYDNRDDTYHVYVTVVSIIGLAAGKTIERRNLSQTMKAIRLAHMHVCDFIAQETTCEVSRDYYDKYGSGLNYQIPRAKPIEAVIWLYLSAKAFVQRRLKHPKQQITALVEH